MSDEKLEPGKVYYFDYSKKTKGVFVFKRAFKKGDAYYFAPIGDPGYYVISGMYEGLVGFSSDVDFKEYKGYGK
jgi:hypothetical protein